MARRRTTENRDGRLLIGAGVVAGPLFVATFTAAGRRQPGYRPRRDPVSSLVLGPKGWVQTANFLTAGLLTCCAAVGLGRLGRSGRSGRRRGTSSLVGAIGLGLIGAGVFPTDPVGEAARDATARTTPLGALHLACAVPVFVGLPAASIAGAFDRRAGATGTWIGYSLGSAAVTMTGAALAGAAFGGHPRLAAQGGTCQRVALVAGLGWLALYSARLSALRIAP